MDDLMTMERFQREIARRKVTLTVCSGPIGTWSAEIMAGGEMTGAVTAKTLADAVLGALDEHDAWQTRRLAEQIDRHSCVSTLTADGHGAYCHHCGRTLS